MNKIIVSIVVSFMTLATYAQNSSSQLSPKVLENALLEVHSGYSLKGHKTLFFVGENLGYQFFNSLSVFAHHEMQYSLTDNNGNKSYQNGNVIGGGLGYKFLYDKNDLLSAEIRALMGHSVGHTGFNHTLYDIGLHLKYGKDLCPLIGIGYRHLNVHSAGISNKDHFYISIGLRFDL